MTLLKSNNVMDTDLLAIRPGEQNVIFDKIINWIHFTMTIKTEKEPNAMSTTN